MPQTSLVVGIGNSLLGADGFGPSVLAAVRHRSKALERTELLDADTDLLSALDRFAAFDHVVVVDAVLGRGSGEVLTFDETAMANWTAASSSGHQISALLALRLFRTLNPTARTRISLVALDVASVTAGAAVPPDKIETAVLSILRLLAA